MTAPSCATPWRHLPQDERPAVLAVLVDAGIEPVELCIDCAADRARIAVADVRQAHLDGNLSARSTVQIGPVLT